VGEGADRNGRHRGTPRCLLSIPSIFTGVPEPSCLLPLGPVVRVPAATIQRARCPMAWTDEEFIGIQRAAIRRIVELTFRDLDEDQKAFPTLDIVDKAFKKAYWSRLIRLICDVYERVQRTPANEEEKWNLIYEVYGYIFPDLPSRNMPDVKNRLDWLQRRVAKEFELDFTRLSQPKVRLLAEAERKLNHGGQNNTLPP